MVYNGVKVETLVAHSLDHKPLLASCSKLGDVVMRNGRLFRYGACWDLEETYSAKVNQLWERHCQTLNPMIRVQALLNRCQQRLKQWSKELYKERQGEIRVKSERLKELQDRERSGVVAEIKELQKDLSNLLEQEGLKWKQRAKKH